MLDSVSIARKHPVTFEGPAPNFFEGALMGNGGLGVVVTTRPDAVCLHLGHNNVWDIRVRERNMDKIGTFQEVFLKIKEFHANPENVELKEWYETYMTLMGENYLSVKYPRPFPCGTVMLFYDRRDAEVLGHTLDISQGLVTVRILTVEGISEVRIVVHPAEDKIVLRMFDSGGLAGKGIFNRIRVMPEKDIPSKLPLYKVSEASEEVLAFTQLLPCKEPDEYVEGQIHPKDKAFTVQVSGCQKLSKFGEGLESRLNTEEPLELWIDLSEGTATDILDKKPEKEAGSFELCHAAAKAAWENYWQKSAVRLEDAFLEEIWYRNLYFFNCATRPGVTCPGLFANWSLHDIGIAWHGDYHMNYNTQQPFWACFSSNHPEKHLTYVSMVEHFLPVSRNFAQEYFGLRGAAYPHSAYPTEMNIMPFPVPDMCWEICETPWTVQSLWWHYTYTRDKSLLKERLFIPLKEAVLFLVDYMLRSEAHGPQWGDDKYHVFPTVVPELYSITKDFKLNKDCIVDLTLIKFVFNAYIEACGVLKVDEIEALTIEQCKHILQHFPPYATVQTPYGEIFANAWEESPEVVHNTPNTPMPVFSGEDIGMDSDRKTYEMAVRTWQRHRNEGGNELVFYNLQGARLGVLDIERFKRQVKYCMLPNGTCGDRVLMSGGRYGDDMDFDFMMHMGIWVENLALPAVVNECLIHGYGDTIRLFPNWSLEKSAEFRDLRVKGAFLISAMCGEGKVDHVTVTSEKGGVFRMYNPWGGSVRCNSETIQGEVLEVDMKPGETLTLAP